MGDKRVLTDAELLKEPMHHCCQGLGVISAQRPVGVARPGKSGAMILYAGASNGMSFRHENQLSEAGQEDHDVAIRLAPCDVMQPDAVYGLEPVFEAVQSMDRTR